MGPFIENLVGEKLEGDWVVESRIDKKPGQTGGCFSVCYIVKKPSGETAFLKALDYTKALQSPDPALALHAMVEAYNFERKVLEKCKGEHLDKVVTAIADGTIRPNSNNLSSQDVVQYLLFELADGDVRKRTIMGSNYDNAWSLRSLHHIAIGLQQIHNHEIAHQDLKPSNVLVFNSNSYKIADFGRASYRGHNSPHEKCNIPGDPTYAPPEQLYGYLIPDWYHRKYSCDAYLLGSMTVFFFTGVGLTPLLLSNLHDSIRPYSWRGSFTEVLPYLRQSFSQVLMGFENVVPKRIKNDLMQIVTQLCELDPSMRGYPKNRGSEIQFSLERYISWFDLLASQAECGLVF